MIKDIDWDYLEKNQEQVLEGKFFENNYTCWCILKNAPSEERSKIIEKKELLKSFLKMNYGHNNRSILDIVLYLEFLEWKLYLLDVKNFIDYGIKLEIFNSNIRVSELDIELFERDLDDIWYFPGICANQPNIKSDKGKIKLNYSEFLESFTLLDVAIMLDNSQYIFETIDKGCNECCEIPYVVPYLEPDGYWYFSVRTFINKEIYNRYKKSYDEKLNIKEIKSPSTSTVNKGMYNILTGGRVKPSGDGTYYLDDFLP